jgi:hypothetical protein
MKPNAFGLRPRESSIGENRMNLLPIFQRGMQFPAPAIIKPRRLAQMGGVGHRARQMEQGDRAYSIDAGMCLSDGLAAVTASGYSQYAAQDGIVDTGGNQNSGYLLPSIASVSSLTPQQARIDAVCVIDVTAVTTSGTASAQLLLVVSNDPAFGPTLGSWQVGSMMFGAAAAFAQPNALVTPTPPQLGASRYEIPFTTERNGVKHQFVKLYVVVANSGSITFKAFIAVLPEP